MTSQTVTVETTQVEEASVRFCDSCGDPLEHKDFEVLARDPSVDFNFQYVDDAIVKVSNGLRMKAKRGDLEKEQYTARPTRGAPRFQTEVVAEAAPNTKREAEQLKTALKNAVSLQTDATLDVCHECLDERLSGPDRSALETIRLEEPEEPDPFTLNDIIDDTRFRACAYLLGVTTVIGWTLVGNPWGALWVAIMMVVFSMTG